MAKTVGKEAGFHQGVMAFFKVAQQLSRREPFTPDQLANMKQQLLQIGQSLPHNEDAFAGALASINELAAPVAPAPSPYAPGAPKTEPLDVRSVEWKSHKGKDGKAENYTANWEGMSLRVERLRDERGKIVFDGFIDDDFFRRGKKRVIVRDEVAAEARRRFMLRKG